MLFTHAQVDRNTISLGNRNISQVRSTKFLGIQIDDKLNYNDHISILSKKLSCTIGTMRRISPLVPPSILKTIYFSLFYSRLIYGITIWGGCGETNINRIRKLQDRASSLIVNYAPNKSMLHFDAVYKYFSVCKFQKCLYQSHSQYFSDKITELFPTHNHNTRYAAENKINIPLSNKSVCHNQYFYNAIKFWNEISPDLKLTLNSKKFKYRLMKSLL